MVRKPPMAGCGGAAIASVRSSTSAAGGSRRAAQACGALEIGEHRIDSACPAAAPARARRTAAAAGLRRCGAARRRLGGFGRAWSYRRRQ